MISRDRVSEVIKHQKPDRIPIYGWVKANMEEKISSAFGSVEEFEDYYEFDLAHIFGGPGCYNDEIIKNIRIQNNGVVEPSMLLDIGMNDPNEMKSYENIIKDIEHHKFQRGRFVYIQTPGIFECLNGPFSIENHLMYLALYESDLHEVYKRQAEWNRQFAINCLDLGADMIHVSDDWGAQNGLMFSPQMWWELIYPYHKITCDAVKKYGSYLSLHSDGNVSQVLDGIIKLGYDVLHPFQESAGMNIQNYVDNYKEKFVIMGGLDVQTTIGFGELDKLKSEIERIIKTFKNGGLLLCTSHFVQDHCSIEELRFAYDLIYDLVRK